ncbi:helix-turn-helix transcriptional regulator [Caballeronia grimmiae]|uniref:helix-turn-helix transcriptional regulator n=1 Tax=Caballeronia grimmiae TaxID=1071679 RepID=UPI001E2F8008|nr:AraC family transcriptional regulator [Caballeronia grimmiae]
MALDIKPQVETYSLVERSKHVDFDIKSEGGNDLLHLPHRHAYFQIKIGLAGEYDQHIGGARRPFRRGSLSFVLPYRIHLVPHPPGARFFMVSFSQAFLFPDLELDSLDLEDADLSKHPELAPFIFQEYLDFHLDETELSVAETILSNMLHEHEHRNFASLGLIRGYLLQLVCSVSNKYANELTSLARRSGQLQGRIDAMQRLSRYIRTNLSEKITLTEAASAAHLSPNYLAHLIKRRTGTTFVELVTERRMEAALDLLSHSNMRIDQISGLCGFSDQAYFTRKFSDRFGMSPRAYRDHLGQHATLARTSSPSSSL